VDLVAPENTPSCDDMRKLTVLGNTTGLCCCTAWTALKSSIEFSDWYHRAFELCSWPLQWYFVLTFWCYWVDISSAVEVQLSNSCWRGRCTELWWLAVCWMKIVLKNKFFKVSASNFPFITDEVLYSLVTDPVSLEKVAIWNWYNTDKLRGIKGWLCARVKKMKIILTLGWKVQVF